MITEAEFQAVSDSIGSIVKEHINMIAVDGKGLAESRERAAAFLVVQSKLNYFLRTFNEDVAKAETLKAAIYYQVMGNVEAKNAPEKKAAIEANANYATAREFHEKLESYRNWTKAHIRIFENAHTQFRQYHKDEQ